jgi:type IV secretory pathway VirB9-like protein
MTRPIRISLAAAVAGLCALAAFAAAAQVPDVPQPGARSYTRAAGTPPGVTIPQTIPRGLSESTEAAIDEQARGNFPVMERGPSLPLGTLQRAWDRPEAASGQSAPAVVHYMWHPDFVMPVRTRDFMVTSIILPVWETAAEYYLGDPLVFEANRVRRNIVAIRSRNAGADSNLTVMGSSGRVYNFYIRSETWNSRQISDLTVYVDSTRPSRATDTDPLGMMSADRTPSSPTDAMGPEPMAAAAAAEPGLRVPDYIRRVAFRPDALQFDMKMYAETAEDAEIAPERVFHDGLFTYFDFGDRADTTLRPVVHLLVDEVDTVVNTRTSGPDGSVLIAEAVGDFTLRNGQRIVCVRWEGRAPAPAAVTIGDRGESVPPAEPEALPPAVEIGRQDTTSAVAPPPPKEPGPQLEIAGPAPVEEEDFFTRLVRFFQGE